MLPTRSRLSAWAVLCALAAGCLPAGGAPRVREPGPARPGVVRAAERGGGLPGFELSLGETYYPVEGTSAPVVNRELRRNGPVHRGLRWHGLTDFRLGYSFEPRPWGEGCRAAETRVRLDIVTTLPRWGSRTAAPAELRSDWDLFLGRLREHEDGHRRITVDAGKDLLKGVQRLRAPDCEELKVRVRRLADAFRVRVELEHRSWDAEDDQDL